MERSSREHHREHKEHREHHREPPTLAFHMKTWKLIHKQLRAISKFTRENTTVTFTPQPSIVIQTSKVHLVSKIIIGSECLYVTDPEHFSTKTINNAIPLFDSFMHIVADPDISKLYVQQDSDLYTRILATASDTCTQASIPCVNGQELIKECGKWPVRIDFEHSTIMEILKWLSPATKNKRVSAKTDITTVQVIIQSNPPVVKFATDLNELEYVHNSKVTFYDIKNMRLQISVKNLYSALAMCAIIKSPCSLKGLIAKDVKLVLVSKSSFLSIENYITQEQTKEDLKFDRCKTDEGGKLDKGSKGDEGSSNRSDAQYKITNYMVSGKASGQGYFNDNKDDSDSDESMNFEYNHCSKRQRCSM